MVKSLVPLKFIAVPRLLDHIGLAMYSKYTKAIGELVVNGYDADASKVWVNVKKDKIVIEDNGTGMDEKNIREGYMLLGSGQKRLSSKTKVFNRLPIGNKGIGKLAGLGIANRIEIITVKDGFKYSFSIDRDKLQSKKTLEEAVFDDFTESPANSVKNGTTVILTKFHNHVKIDVDQLRSHLALEVPQDKNFIVYVNNEVSSRKDIPAKRKIDIDEIVLGVGLVCGEIIVAKKSLTNIQPGIITTVRNRAVGKPSLFNIYSSRHRFFHSMSSLITGTVEVADFDPEEADDDRPIIQTDREGFIEDHPKYIAYAKFITSKLFDILKEEEDELNRKQEMEKDAKVNDALKNVIKDFNDFQKEKNEKILSEKENYSGLDQDAKGEMEAVYSASHSDFARQKASNFLGIKDPQIRKEIAATQGAGHILIDNKKYKLVATPLGEDDVECRIDDEKLLVIINTSHPAYDAAIASKTVEVILFRAIADACACKESKSPLEMYEKIDELIRFHSKRMGKRKSGNDIFELLIDDNKLETQHLSSKEKEVLKLRFGIRNKEHRLDEIGKKFGFTKQRAKQIIENALSKISFSSESKINDNDIELIKNLVNERTHKILKIVSIFYEVSVKELLGRKRDAQTAKARQIVMFLLRKDLNLSFPQIGKALSNRDHTTAIHAFRKIGKDTEKNEKIKQEIQKIEAQLSFL